MTQVAILQNQIGFDGRSRVAIEIIRLLNDRGVVPHLVTLSTAKHRQQFDDAAVGLQYRLRSLPVPLSRGYAPQVLLSNLFGSLRERRAAKIVTLNDNFFLLRAGIPALHYISDPLDYLMSHGGDSPATVVNRTYWTAVRIACGRLPARPTGTVIANSAFTRERLQSSRPDVAEPVEVIPPPCVSTEEIQPRSPTPMLDIVTVGTYSSAKGQLEQLAIARRHPDWRMAIIGSVWSRRYYRRCQVAAAKLPNVKLLSDVNERTIADTLSRSSIYLHTKANEGFGITTVEAIARGCLPVVHDSGGQREVVPDSALRFATVPEMEEILGTIMVTPDAPLAARVSALQRHIRAFSSETFRERMSPHIESLLATTRPVGPAAAA